MADLHLTRPMARPVPPLLFGKRRGGAYLAVTTVVVAECAVGGTMDVFRLPPFYPTLIALGYPGYLAPMLGLAKVGAAVVLAAPRLPRLKEWAYAGVVINMVGAAASQAATRHRFADVLVPSVFAGAALLSWALRPSPRRL